MYAQLTYFDGPRSPELIAAADRANRERIDLRFWPGPTCGMTWSRPTSCAARMAGRSLW